MARKGWYLVAYDISCPKRLARVHRTLKKEGLAVQKSVFFVQETEKGIHHLLNRLGRIIRTGADDIRAYPVTHPGHSRQAKRYLT